MNIFLKKNGLIDDFVHKRNDSLEVLVQEKNNCSKVNWGSSRELIELKQRVESHDTT